MSDNTEKKIEVLNRRLGEFADAYRNFQKIGISEDILLAYVMFKTKMSQKSIKAILNTQTEFYQKLVNNAMLDNLEDDND